MNSEAIVCLERALGTRRLDPDAFLARVDTLRERLSVPPVTEERLGEAKGIGRP